MISRQELLELAADFGLSANVVEKDYALGWVLTALGEHSATRDAWLFKGGTCLKKCFFETYRFSEDLDFTLLEPDHLDGGFLGSLFTEIAGWVYEETGLVLPPEARKIDVFTNSRGGLSAEGRIGYRGPLARAGDAPRIKLDLTDHERVMRPADRRAIHHPYSDRHSAGMLASTYSFEELFAEKIRALAERLRPRDLYDVAHVFRHRELDLDRAVVIETLRGKCDFKGIAVPTLASLQSSPLLNELRSGWDQMLRHQLPQLPSFESFWSELPDVMDWLFGEKSRVELPGIRVRVTEGIDESWRPSSMATSWRSLGVTAPLEVIRFAAANRLCVDLDYRDENGRRSSRLIEPYSLRRTDAGNLLLLAVKADTGDSRSYRVDRVVGATATQREFNPRFAVELSESGPLRAPSVDRPAGASSLRRPGNASRPGTPRAALAGGPEHVFRCTICDKTFRRKTFDSTLNAHKGRNGLPCPGRVGAFVRTDY